MEKEVKGFRNRIFTLVYIIYGIFSVIEWSQISTIYNNYEKIYLVSQIVCIPVLVFLFISSHPRKKIFILYIIIASYALGVGFFLKDTRFLMFILFFFAAVNVDYKNTFRKDIIIKILLFLIIFLAYKAGYLNTLGIISRETGEIRQTFGFSYPTYVMYMIMIISMEWIIIRAKQLTYLELVLISLLGYFFGKVTDARGETVTLYFVIIGVLLACKLFKSKSYIFLENKLIRTLLIIAPEIACVLAYLLVIILKPGSMLYGIINRFSSWRLDIFQIYLHNYGIRIFPAKLSLNYLGADGKWVQVIDNCYLYLGIQLGIICLITYLIIFSYLIKNALDYHRIIMVVIMIGFVILNTVEYVTLSPAIALYCVVWSKNMHRKEVRKRNETRSFSSCTNL